MSKNLAIILINWNGYEDTIECLNSIQASSIEDMSVFIIDNSSSDNSIDKIEKWSQTKSKWSNHHTLTLDALKNAKSYAERATYLVTSDKNLGFAKGNNAIWKVVYDKFEHVLILNNDTIVDKYAFERMLDTMHKHPEVAALSCDIRYYDNREKLWHSGGKFTWYGDRKYYPQTTIDAWKKDRDFIETEFITGCAMMVRKTTVENIGFYTEKFFFGEEDFNYCQRLKKAGLTVATVLSATIYHKVSGSVKKRQEPYNKFILHFANRIINQKDFMGGLQWHAWRLFYMMAVFLKAMQTFKDVRKSVRVVRRIMYYTSRFDRITYKTFIEIGNLNGTNL